MDRFTQKDHLASSKLLEELKVSRFGVTNTFTSHQKSESRMYYLLFIKNFKMGEVILKQILSSKSRKTCPHLQWRRGIKQIQYLFLAN